MEDIKKVQEVVDYREDSNFVQQLFGIKTVKVFSGDRTTPCLNMMGMDRTDDLIPTLRERVTYNRMRNGVYEITNR